ncbi:MAG: CDF family Co(II)/Ni(II) efflux transporter DmeF [Ramlibacter sp.]
MQTHNHSHWRHGHVFDSGNIAGERGTRMVMWITAAMMVAEVVAGWFYNSMALLADGFHMSSHAVAIGLSAFAYAAARKHSGDARFAFGTWKIEVLGGFASAIFLLVVVALMLFASVDRLISPQPIHYEEAIAIAAIGLIVNIVSAWILGAAHHDHGGHGHGGHHDHGHPEHDHHGHDHHGHDHGHAHAHQPARGHQHLDLNLRSAYIHVVADAATSVLAIGALLGGWLYGWAWLDPATGIFGAVVVALWAKRLIGDTAKVLLDREMDHPIVKEIEEAIEQGGRPGETEVTDLHVWRVGKGTYSCAVTVVTHDPALTPATVRQWISPHKEVVHSTIEVQVCGEGAQGA